MFRCPEASAGSITVIWSTNPPPTESGILNPGNSTQLMQQIHTPRVRSFLRDRSSKVSFATSLQCVGRGSERGWDARNLAGYVGGPGSWSRTIFNQGLNGLRKRAYFQAEFPKTAPRGLKPTLIFAAVAAPFDFAQGRLLKSCPVKVAAASRVPETMRFGSGFCRLCLP